MTKKQRRRVWGSVTEMRRGKKYVLRWMQNTPQGRRRKTKTVYGTYREACAELDRIHVEHADDAPVPTIAKAYETWLVPKMAAQVEAGTLAPNTRDLVLRSWKNYVGPRWGQAPVDQLRAVELQDWLLTLPASIADAHPRGFMVHAQGGCMDNRFPHDALLLVDPDMEPVNGQPVLAETADYGAVVRNYTRGRSTVMLTADSHSGEYDDILAGPGDEPVVCKGRIVWYMGERDER